MESKCFSEILRKAVAGESDAVEAILYAYMPLIIRHSVIENKYDEDMQQYIIMSVVLQLSKFNLDALD